MYNISLQTVRPDLSSTTDWFYVDIQNRDQIYKRENLHYPSSHSAQTLKAIVPGVTRAQYPLAEQRSELSFCAIWRRNHPGVTGTNFSA